LRAKQDERRLGTWKERKEETHGDRVVVFNDSVKTLVNHLTSYYGEEAELETYVICVSGRSTNIPGGSGLNWIVGPDDHEWAGGPLREVLEAVEGDGNSGGQS
jgi:hypothetical protein